MGIQINGQTDTISASDGSLSAIGLDLSSVTSINASGVSTFSNGPVLIGSGTSTGTSSQPLQVTGGAYVSGNVGIGYTNPGGSGSKLDVAGSVRLGRIDASNEGGELQFNRASDDTVAFILDIVGSGSTPRFRMFGGSGGSGEVYTVDWNRNFIIGASLATGTASQPLQVTGGAYVSGSVGIGITNPGANLDIGNEGDLWLSSPDNTVEEKNIISWRIEDRSEGARISAFREALANAPHSLLFHTRTSAGAFTEKLRITSSGNVGIGITNPDSPLTVYGNIAAELTAFINNANSGGYSALRFGNSDRGTNGDHLVFGGSSLGLRSKTGTSIVFEPAGTQRASIDSTGNFSITQTPGKYTVDITGGATTIANNGTIDFSNASGMLVVNNHTNGAVTIYLCGGANTLAVSSVVAQVGTLTYVAGIAGYRWTNTYGSAATFGFFFVRTRTTA